MVTAEPVSTATNDHPGFPPRPKRLIGRRRTSVRFRASKGMLVAAISAAFLASSLATSGSAVSTVPRRMVIVAWPGLTWEDAAKGRTPNLLALAERFSFAAMSGRTVRPRTDIASAYATLGAGSRARGLGPFNSFPPPRTHAREEGGLMVVGMRQVREDNFQSVRFRAHPGLLGTALREAGLRTAAIGNADGLGVNSDDESRTPVFQKRTIAGMALADSSGRLDEGYVGEDLVLSDLDDPARYRLNAPRILEEFDRAQTADVILVELSDTFREDEILFPPGGLQPPDRQDDPARIRALARDDALLRELLSRIDLHQDAFWVVAPIGLGSGARERLTAVAAAGVGIGRGGLLTSPSTRRSGLVTLTDIAPSVLRGWRLDIPKDMIGIPVSSDPGIGRRRLEMVTRPQAAAIFHSTWITVFWLSLVGSQALLYGAAVGVVLGRRRGGRWLRFATLAVLAVPGSSQIWHLLRPDRLGLLAGPALAAIAVGLAAVALAGPWRKSPNRPAAFLVITTFLMIAVDLVTGAHLELSSMLGYSPVFAGRFYGIGNVGFAVFATCAMLAVAEFARLRRPFSLVLALIAGGLATFINGAPGIGADFGGLISLVVGFGVLVMLLVGTRISVVRVGALVAAALVVALAVGYVDSLRPPEAQTHIGRFVAQLLRGGPRAVSDVILRKAEANWGLITRSVLTLSLVVAGTFLLVVLRKPRGLLKAALKSAPGLRPGLIAVAAVNLAGFAVNDSGITIPAMGIAVATPYLLSVMLAVEEQPAMRRAPRLGGDGANGRIPKSPIDLH